MNNNTKAALVAASMLAMALVPLASAAPSGSPDATIAGPASVDAKYVLGAGVGFCQSDVPGGPLDCNAAAGTISAAGAYAYDTTGCTGSYGCNYDVWAIQTGGAEVTGWGISTCTDRDDSGICTNVGSNFDDFGEGYAGDVLAGSDKETKDGYAHAEFCVRLDVAAAGGDYDNFWVFITAWADENVVFGDNLGAGAGVGTFDIYVEGEAAVDSAAGCPHTGDD